MKILRRKNFAGVTYVIPASRESFLKTQKDCGQAAMTEISKESGFTCSSTIKFSFILHRSSFILWKSGFTLLEVLIALALTGGLLVTLIYTLNYHLSLVERQEAVTAATLLARNKVAEMEQNPESGKGFFEAPYDGYSFETFVKDSPYAGISEIVVVVKAGSEEVKLNEFVLK